MIIKYYVSGTELASEESGASLVSWVCEPAADTDMCKYTCIKVHCIFIYFQGSEVKDDVIGSFRGCKGDVKRLFAKMLTPWESSKEWVGILQADRGEDRWRQEKQQAQRCDNTNPQGRAERRVKLTSAKYAAAGQHAKPLPQVNWIFMTICDLSTNITPISQMRKGKENKIKNLFYDQKASIQST